MLSAERQQAIRQLVAREGVVQVAALAAQYRVSSSTIRRDLLQLERQGTIRRVHGGAAAPEGVVATPDVAQIAGRIGRATAGQVRSDETVYLGPGRLTLATAKALVANGTRVTVVTNSLEIGYWLIKHGRGLVILTGGTAGRDGDGLSGPLTRYALRTLRADRVIVELAGVSPDQGLMGADLAQAEICRELIGGPGETIALVDPQRVGGLGGVLIGPASEVDVIVTGREASDAFLWDLSQMGISVLSV